MNAGKRERAALGVVVHTGWAAVVAVAGGSAGIRVIDRRRLEMIPGKDPGRPPFVYHAASKLPLASAETMVQEWSEHAFARAKAGLESARATLEAMGHPPSGAGLVVTGRTPTSGLETILRSHALIHAAEGELFRQAVRGATRVLQIPLVEVGARELSRRAADALGVPRARLEQALIRIGRAAGRPWAKDQKEGCLAAAVALSSRR